MDTTPVGDFERGLAAFWDAVDRLRGVKAPAEAEGIKGIVKWANEITKAISVAPAMPDSDPLKRFAEDVEREVGQLKGTVGNLSEREKRYPRDDGIIHLLPKMFFARVTGSSGADNQWAYTFVEVEKTVAGYGGWTTLTGGRSGTMRNTIEDINAATGTQGNGVDVANLSAATYTFTVQECPTNVVVPAWEVGVGAVTEYWFAYENGVDGTCV